MAPLMTERQSRRKRTIGRHADRRVAADGFGIMRNEQSAGALQRLMMERHLLIAGAAATLSLLGGVSLGNFATGGWRNTGIDAQYDSPSDAFSFAQPVTIGAVVEKEPDEQPPLYERGVHVCTGCDAGRDDDGYSRDRYQEQAASWENAGAEEAALDRRPPLAPTDDMQDSVQATASGTW